MAKAKRTAKQKRADKKNGARLKRLNSSKKRGLTPRGKAIKKALTKARRGGKRKGEKRTVKPTAFQKFLMNNPAGGKAYFAKKH